MNPPVSPGEPGSEDKKGVLSVDTTVFVISLCVIALGALLSYIIEQRSASMNREES
jgi:hypothetical protein